MLIEWVNFFFVMDPWSVATLCEKIAVNNSILAFFLKSGKKLSSDGNFQFFLIFGLQIDFETRNSSRMSNPLALINK